MTIPRKLVLTGAVVVGALVPAQASAHRIVVTTPSGQTQSQFLGGPGNPGHAGHHGGPSGNGHLAACDAVEHNSGAGTVNFLGAGCDF